MKDENIFLNWRRNAMLEYEKMKAIKMYTLKKYWMLLKDQEEYERSLGNLFFVYKNQTSKAAVL